MAVSNRKNVKIKSVTLLGILALVVLCVWGIWRFSLFGQAPSQLQAELLSAKADGLPLDANDLRQTTSASDNQNAAGLLNIALSQYREFKDSQEGKELSKLTSHRGGVAGLTSDELASASGTIAHESQLFDTLDQVVKMPKLDFHRKWELGPSLSFSEFTDEKGCVNLLAIRARIDMKVNNPQRALDSLDVAAKISRLVGQEPVLIGVLVQASLRSIDCAVLTELLQKYSGDAAVLNRSKTVLNDMGPSPDILPAIRSEFLMGRTAVKMLASVEPSQLFGTDSANATMNLARFGPVRTVYELRYAQVYHDMYKKLSQRPGSIAAMTQVFQSSGQDFDSKSRRDWTYGLADILAPTYSGLGGAIGEAEARRHVMVSAIELFEAKLASGQFPSKILGQTGNWMDPFTEKPLIYKPSKNGFLIYSVGRDLKDDGGKTRPKEFTSMEQTYDIPFKFPADPVEEPSRTTSRGRPSAPSLPGIRR